MSKEEVTSSTHGITSSDAAAMTSFKWPPSLKPMLPILVYQAMCGTILTMVGSQLPAMWRVYFGSNTEASFWASLFDSANAFIGLFVSGLFGLAADAYGRKMILMLSAVQMCFVLIVLWYFGDANPWPFLVVANSSSIIGSTKIGNTAVCFMVIADVFDKDCRLVPTIIFVVTVFAGVMPGVLPAVLGMAAGDVIVLAVLLSLGLVVFVALFFRETLPVEARKVVNLSDLHNPLVPLRFVFQQSYLVTLSALAVTFLFPVYLSSGISIYYLDEKLGGFTQSDNSVLGGSTALATVLGLVVGLPILTKLMEVENIVMLGVVSIVLNSVVYCFVTATWQAFVFLAMTEGTAFASITLLTQMVSVGVPQNEQGVVNGTLAAFKEIAIIAGPILGALLFSVGKDISLIELPFILSIIVACGGVAVVGLRLAPEIRRRRFSSLQSSDTAAMDVDDDVDVESPVSAHVDEEMQ